MALDLALSSEVMRVQRAGRRESGAIKRLRLVLPSRYVRPCPAGADTKNLLKRPARHPHGIVGPRDE